jgi:hypothetical protein
MAEPEQTFIAESAVNQVIADFLAAEQAGRNPDALHFITHLSQLATQFSNLQP